MRLYLRAASIIFCPSKTLWQAGFSHVDVLAGLAWPRSWRARASDWAAASRPRRTLLSAKTSPHVGIALRLLAGGLLHQRLAPLERRLVHIAERHDPGVRQLEVRIHVIAPAAAQADHRDGDFVVGAAQSGLMPAAAAVERKKNFLLLGESIGKRPFTQSVPRVAKGDCQAGICEHAAWACSSAVGNFCSILPSRWNWNSSLRRSGAASGPVAGRHPRPTRHAPPAYDTHCPPAEPASCRFPVGE